MHLVYGLCKRRGFAEDSFYLKTRRENPAETKDQQQLKEYESKGQQPRLRRGGIAIKVEHWDWIKFTALANW